MRKIKPYTYNGVKCSDLNSLAEEYIKDFFNGMEDIYSRSKELIKFVKACRRDKEFTTEIANILTKSKYKNSALTFIIFAFTGYGRIIINGVEMTFMSFIKEFSKAKGEENNALKGFLEDFGISKTFALVEKDENVCKNARAIEENYNHPFTKKYLESYYDFVPGDSITNKISNVVLGNEECFRKGSKLTRDLKFQLEIAHSVGFKEAIMLNKEINPLFEAVKIIKATNECEDEKLIKLITDTFYWWLLDNLDKYQPKSRDAKTLFESIEAVGKNVKKYNTQIEKKKIDGISVEMLADFSKELYLYYLDFVTLYRADQIIVKRKYKNSYDFVFDKPYCDTFITQSFMEGKVIKLHTGKEEETKKRNVLTDELIDLSEEEELEEKPLVEEDAPIEEDTPLEEDVKGKKKKNKKDKEKLVGSAKPLNLKKLNKKITKNGRFKAFTIFEIVLFALIITAAVVITELNVYSVEGFKEIYSQIPVIAAAGGSLAMLLILGPILGHNNRAGLSAASDLMFIDNTRKLEDKSVQIIEKLEKLEAKSNKNIKNVKKSSRVVTALMLTFTSLIFYVVLLFALCLAQKLDLLSFLANLNLGIELKLDFVSRISGNTMLIAMGSSALVALVYGLIKKYKGILSVLLVNLLVLIVTLLVFVLV